MNTNFDMMRKAVLDINWRPDLDNFDRKLALGKEYLRRISLWRRIAPPTEPAHFYDVAAEIAPELELPTDLVEQFEKRVAGEKCDDLQKQICLNALRFALLQDAGLLRGIELPNPYSPLITLYALGGSVHTHKGFLNIDLGAIRLTERDWTTLDPLKLPIDAAHELG